MKDIELINLYKEGDNRAFTTLFERYQASVTNIFTKHVSNKSDIDDLVMAVFIKVFNHIDKYEPSNTFNAWITKIAHNTLVDYYRRRKRIPSTIENITDERTDFMETVASTNGTPEELFIKSQSHDELREIISKLKPNQRKIVELRFFKDMKYEDIASELGIPLGTVKAQIYRVKHLLNKKIIEISNENDADSNNSQEQQIPV